MTSHPTAIIGVASGYGAGNPECRDAPAILKKMGVLDDLESDQHVLRWSETISTDIEYSDRLRAICCICEQLAEHVRQHLQRGEIPLVIGGDHSCAIGTWSGVKKHLGMDARLGLIWIDAHMDSHTFQTSPSQNIHGMPLASLLGHGEECLTRIATDSPKLNPDDVCLIGVRSYESEEAALLEKLGVRIYYMDEVREKGLSAVFSEARSLVCANTAGYGISLDLDAIDPNYAPGVGTPVSGGLFPEELIEAISTTHDDAKLLALEIVEYNPSLDRHFITARTIHDICQALITVRKSKG